MLKVISARDALNIILEHSGSFAAESQAVPICDCVGRTAADDIISGESIPAFNRSSVDGFAAAAADTYGCSEAVPAMLAFKGKILMGEKDERAISRGECMEIPTGGRLPDGADCAVMLEFTEDYGDEFRYIQKPCAPLENVICAGDDIKSGQIIIKKGGVLRPCDTGALAAAGICEIPVVKKLTVGIISTGDELVPCNAKPSGSEIRDVNSTLLNCCVSQAGCTARVYPIIRDDSRLLTDCVRRAADECDCILISGGSSVGERDAVLEVLSSLGEVKFHGIAIKPGKPTLFADVNGKPVFGLPGHPLAAFFVFRLFALPLLDRMGGVIRNEQTVAAILKTNIPSNHGREEVIPVSLDFSTDIPAAAPLSSKSGVVSVLARANGYIRIDRNSEGLAAHSTVAIHLL